MEPHEAAVNMTTVFEAPFMGLQVCVGRWVKGFQADFAKYIPSIVPSYTKTNSLA